MIYDTFTYNGEREVLDIHLNVLDEWVDKFIIVEAKTTFSGLQKPLYWSLQERFFEKFWHKIEYYVVDEEYSEAEFALAKSSPNTRGAAHWTNEFLQKESILKALEYFKVQDSDRVYIGDVDEIWEQVTFDEVVKLKLLVYAYWLNNRSNEPFWGTISGRWGQIKDHCLNHLRTGATRTLGLHGWHFTSMGGLDEVRRKLNASYTPESYNTYEVQELLSHRLKEGQDYLGRPFEFWLDESEWPEYLTRKRFKYSHLCKENTPSGVSSMAAV